jgi:hypothetical protein
MRLMMFRFALAPVLLGAGLVGCANIAPVAPVTAPDARPLPDTASVTKPAESVPAPAVEPEAVPVTQLSLREFIERNDERLLHVFVGMSRQGVDRLMNGQRSGLYTNPFRQQSISLGDGRRFDVLYYLTREPHAGKGITETMLTPVIFRNDRIVAIGRYPLKKLRRGECPANKPSACQ